MNRKNFAVILCICCLLALAGCRSGPEAVQPSPSALPSPQVSQSEAPAQPSPSPTPSPDASAPSTPEPTPSPSPEPALPLTDEAIAQRYAQAITALEGELTLDVTGREWKYGAENDLKNIYYALLSQRPELKYAYDMTAAVSDSAAVCTFSYMPYKTGAYDQGLPPESHTVSSLHDAFVMAQSMIDGTERLSIAITDPALEVEDLQRAVKQAGYGWISFDLSPDGTEIVATPAAGMTLQECAGQINESFSLAGEALGTLISEGMTDREKITAVYTYITETVAYDFRYYSSKEDMAFASTVALGALRDGLAICGGYAHALETMLTMCGIENYTVSGTAKGEYHAWNYVLLDGQGYYCDPTADRHGMKNHFLLTEEEFNADGGYVWDTEFYPKLRRT